MMLLNINWELGNRINLLTAITISDIITKKQITSARC